MFVLSQCLTASSQYWQQQVNYTIDVSLNDKEHTLDAFEKIEYVNNSPDTLTYIWFHIWPNAYKNDKTAFSDQLLENGSTKFYFSDKEQKGYINKLDFKVNNSTVKIEDHPQHIDIIKIILPTPLPPHQKITITTPFHVKLPYNFSRGGHDGQSYQATQWYPKPAVYDAKGWHAMPYLDQGEFYSEFGSFDVSITVPKNYVVAATGDLQNETEKEWLKSRSSFTWEAIKRKEKTVGGQMKTTYQLFPESAAETKTLTYKQNNVHDFAWFADKRFIVNYDTCRLSSGKIIDAVTYYTPKHKDIWKNSVTNTKDAIRHYSSLVSEYPYNIVQVVQGPESFGGGMEYPTVTIISPTSNARELDYTIAHEIGHNWFYGILGSNEREHPWMDEGINSYYETKYSQQKDHHFNERSQQTLLETFVAEKKDQPIELPSENFTETNYGLIVYYKTSQWLAWLEKYVGAENFNKAMQAYYQQWQFKHPQPKDFKQSLETSTGKNLDSAFTLLAQKGNLPNVIKKGITVQDPITALMRAMLGANDNKKSVISFMPVFGLNSYDKLMPGIAITNLRLPTNRFQFLLLPMYGTGSKKMTGIGFLNYSFFPTGIFRKIDLGVSGSTFTADKFVDPDEKKFFLQFNKIVPGIKFRLNQKNPRTTLNRYIQFKSYFIGEDELSFYRDTVISGLDTTIANKFRTVKENRVLNQLKLVIENNRVLYPYRGELKVEQGEDFIRTAFTGKYFFNYVKGGGLNVRLFAGKFLYTGSKTSTKQFATDRYHLNMTGANGYEDYTYSDYFLGRNKFEGFASQQIMERDGGFKVRTDLLADKVGKTDDWLVAANFSTTIPDNINPLNLLPIKIPLRIFFDIGTYAEAWKQKAETDRFLFDIGFHIPLFKETINIYIPLIYSDVYKNYIQSTLAKNNRLLKTISFSIDISNFSFRKIDRNFDF